MKRACPSGELDEVKEAIGPSLVELASDLFHELKPDCTRVRFRYAILSVNVQAQLTINSI